MKAQKELEIQLQLLMQLVPSIWHYRNLLSFINQRVNAFTEGDSCVSAWHNYYFLRPFKK